MDVQRLPFLDVFDFDVGFSHLQVPDCEWAMKRVCDGVFPSLRADLIVYFVFPPSTIHPQFERS
jgi:hypothetical protein